MPEPRRAVLRWVLLAAFAIVAAIVLYLRPRVAQSVFDPAPAVTAGPVSTAPQAAAPPDPPRAAAIVPTPAPASATPGSPTPRPAEKPSAGSTSAPAPAETAASPIPAAPETSDTAPEGETPAPVYTGLTLEGVVWSADDPVAMINGRILRVGGYVNGYTITKIEPDAVELKGEKGTIRLKVGSGSMP
jgi:hypothetical protein